jgi:hypothetical protein
MSKIAVAAALLLCLCAVNARAQAPATTSVSSPSSPTAAAPQDTLHQSLPPIDGPVKGSNVWEVWAGNAYPIRLFDDAPLAHVWTAGVTVGRVLTDEHGAGPLRGRFEWDFELVPVVEVYLPHHTVYSGGFDPVILRWDFVNRRRFSPYFEWYGGAIFSNHQVVPGTSTFNFTPGAAIGTSVPWGRSGKYSMTFDVRYFHISNAGITDYNPGINTIEVRVGFGQFTHPK